MGGAGPNFFDGDIHRLGLLLGDGIGRRTRVAAKLKLKNSRGLCLAASVSLLLNEILYFGL